MYIFSAHNGILNIITHLKCEFFVAFVNYYFIIIIILIFFVFLFYLLRYKIFLLRVITLHSLA